MSKLIPLKQADRHVNFVGSFYVASGLWELFLGMFAYESITSYYLSGRDPIFIYNDYMLILGFISIVIGMGTLNRSRFFRKTAIALAIWNILSNPAIYVYLVIYEVYVRKISVITMSFPQYVIVGFLEILLVAIPRIYIVYILRMSKAGYIFSRR